MEKILITGGAGFIGSEFIRLCIKNDLSIVVIDKLTYAGDLERLNEIKEKITFYKEDICNEIKIENIFNLEKPDFVVHMAAESHVDKSIDNPEIFINTNVKGTMVMLNVSKKYNVKKFINISTDEVYGDLSINSDQFMESTSLNPSSPYSTSKAAADMLGRSYFRTYNFPVITVRPSNNYGPWQYPEKLIPVTISKILADEKIPIYGDGQNIREWLYVEDCAKGIFKILFFGKIGEIYNLGGGQEKNNLFVVKKIISELQKNENLISFVKDRLGHDFRYSVNCEKLKKEIGWEPTINFEEGCKKTVQWYVDNENWWKNKLN